MTRNKPWEMHSSKGPEFNRVIIAGVGEGCSEEDQATEVRLLYIAMTRAMQNLLITSCADRHELCAA